MLTNTYAGLWNKYRPALLKMMMNAATEPQSYQLSVHEFKAFNNGKNTTFSFDFEILDGKASGLKSSLVAQDLWEILRQSPKVNELIASGSYRFSMNKQFVLNVQRNNN
jgi:hypothetical protein